MKLFTVKSYSLVAALLIMSFFFGACKKDREADLPTVSVTSAEFDGKLLFVNKNDFQIQTSEEAVFTANDKRINITADGLVKRLTSGEVVSIEVAPKNAPERKTLIYALGATDTNHDKPQITYNGKGATDTYNSYLKGWSTLQKLPSANETYVLVVRHADADQGVDYSLNHSDPGPANWWKSADSSLARQLNEEGRTRSRELGLHFKGLAYPIARVYTSEFRRAIETAELFELNLPLIQDKSLNHPSYNRSNLFKGLLNILEGIPNDNKITLVVTHHPINEIILSGAYPSFPDVSPFNWTGMYLVKISPDRTFTYEGAVSWGMVKYWHDTQAAG